MVLNLVTADAFAELSILLEKAAAALDCIVDKQQSIRDQALTDIAGDYLTKIGEMIRAMQESGIKMPL